MIVIDQYIFSTFHFSPFLFPNDSLTQSATIVIDATGGVHARVLDEIVFIVTNESVGVPAYRCSIYVCRSTTLHVCEGTSQPLPIITVSHRKFEEKRIAVLCDFASKISVTFPRTRKEREGTVSRDVLALTQRQ